MELLESFAAAYNESLLDATDSLSNYLYLHPELRTPIGDLTIINPGVQQWTQDFTVTGGGTITLGQFPSSNGIKILAMHVPDALNELASGYDPNKQTLVGARLGCMVYEIKAAGFGVIRQSNVSNPPVWGYMRECAQHMGLVSNSFAPSAKLADRLAGLN